MTTQPHSVPIRQPQLQIQAHIGIPSLRTIILGLVALLILFRWLHLILALQTATAGREIQIRNGDLMRQQRQNSLLRSEIAKAEAPRALAKRARQLGLVPRSPVYLPIDATAVGPESDAALPCAEVGTETCRAGAAFAAGSAPDRGAVSGLRPTEARMLAWETGYVH